MHKIALGFSIIKTPPNTTTHCTGHKKKRKLKLIMKSVIYFYFLQKLKSILSFSKTIQLIFVEQINIKLSLTGVLTVISSFICIHALILTHVGRDIHSSRKVSD